MQASAFDRLGFVFGFNVRFRILFATVFLVLVSFDVFAEMVASHEPLAADGTLEAFLSRVCANVPLELVRTRESLAAEQPVADERSFAGVPAKVSFQVRSLVVELATSGYVACVNVALAQMGAGRSQPISVLTIRAVARATSRVASLSTWAC